jgi:hypothetical protein
MGWCAGLPQTILLCLHCRVKSNLRKYSSSTSRKQTVDPITAVKDPYRPVREIEKTVTVRVWRRESTAVRRNGTARSPRPSPSLSPSSALPRPPNGHLKGLPSELSLPVSAELHLYRATPRLLNRPKKLNMTRRHAMIAIRCRHLHNQTF